MCHRRTHTRTRTHSKPSAVFQSDESNQFQQRSDIDLSAGGTFRTVTGEEKKKLPPKIVAFVLRLGGRQICRNVGFQFKRLSLSVNEHAGGQEKSFTLTCVFPWFPWFFSSLCSEGGGGEQLGGVEGSEMAVLSCEAPWRRQISTCLVAGT